MVHAKDIRVQILGILALIVALWVCIGAEVRAEDDILSGTFEYNGQEITYYYFTGSFYYYTPLGYKLNHTPDRPVYVIPVGYNSGSKFSLLCFCEEQFGGVEAGSTTLNSYLRTASNGSTYYNASLGYTNNSASLSPNIISDSGLTSIYTAFGNYFTSDDFDDLQEIIPVWRSADSEPRLKLRNFFADVVDDTYVGASWAGIVREIMPASVANVAGYENTYVKLIFALCSTDGTQYPIIINYPEGSLTGATPYKISDNGFIVELSELDIPDGYRLWYVQATPYWYENDDITGQLKVGCYSQVYFDEDWGYSYTETKAPSATYDEEDPEKSIWDSITDFTSNIGSEIGGVLYDLFVPDSDSILALLDEMNAWFSERFGFIWYPFDLAIDIVAAFALGEADSMFTVPALTLNMFGGVTLWEEFETDLDAFGVMQYVRYFTSAILAASTVSLAVRKFDEWIGGRNS